MSHCGILARAAALLALTFTAWPCGAQGWDAARTPTRARAEVIGGPANGCLAGAQSLPLEGRGYQVIRASRNRYWAHPETIRFVQGFAAQMHARGFAPVYIGDLSQPRGGVMPYGHASHQNGTDVDIWFSLLPKPVLAAAQREEVELPSLVRADRTMNHDVFEPRHVEMLRVAATHPRVERIFVNFVIKRELCETVRGDRTWLRRIRPWLGHDSHFHVRLACPADSRECVAQAAIPPGDGCDEVELWFRPPPPDARSIRPPRPPPPPRCRAVLAQ